MKLIALIIFITMSSFSHSSSHTYTIKINDRNGHAVSGAIVTFMNTSEESAASTYSIDQKNYKFEPQVLLIKKGDTVLFPNNDSVRHHVYSFSSPKVFEINLYKGSDGGSIVFDNPGLIVLGCNIHDSMIGYIYISDNHVTKITNSQGEATISVPPSENVFVWHQKLNVDVTKKQKIILTKTKKREWAGSLPIEIKKSKEPAKRFGNDFY